MLVGEPASGTKEAYNHNTVKAEKITKALNAAYWFGCIFLGYAHDSSTGTIFDPSKVQYIHTICLLCTLSV